MKIEIRPGAWNFGVTAYAKSVAKPVVIPNRSATIVGSDALRSDGGGRHRAPATVPASAAKSSATKPMSPTRPSVCPDSSGFAGVIVVCS